MPNLVSAACKVLSLSVDGRRAPGPLAGWSAAGNFATGVPFSSPTITATFPNAIAKNDVGFALITSNVSDATAPLGVNDPSNGAWTRLAYAIGGNSNPRYVWLYCFPLMKAALANTLVVTAAQAGGTYRMHIWTHTPPAAIKTLTIGAAAPGAGGNAGVIFDPGPLTTTQVALIISAARQLGTTAIFTPFAGFALVGGQVDGVMQATAEVDAPAGTYDPAITGSAGAAAPWCAVAASLYAIG